MLRIRVFDQVDTSYPQEPDIFEMPTGSTFADLRKAIHWKLYLPWDSFTFDCCLRDAESQTVLFVQDVTLCNTGYYNSAELCGECINMKYFERMFVRSLYDASSMDEYGIYYCRCVPKEVWDIVCDCM